MTDKKIILTGFQDVSSTAAREQLQDSGGLDGERKPLFVDPARIRMLPPELRDYNCASCDRRSAGWAFLPSDKGPDPDPIPVCSLCWFYVLPWGTSRSDELVDFLLRFEAIRNKSLLRDKEGRLTNHREGDEALLQLLKSSILAVRLAAQETERE